MQKKKIGKSGETSGKKKTGGGKQQYKEDKEEGKEIEQSCLR